ncbi:sugar phosphate isomerase/epimerase [Haloarcula sp. JP-Z28]|uniref:Sugar phosphate isomerase/epimerase n=2 Tax=Haloarcula marismortui ATCC 33800 TaxID=662476 RepID=A0A8T8KMM2_9EURY|nr:sugar phosphate isomerase/epimerase [Haloarcula sp. JP-Z28]QUJ74305.1 sugar phosphate isomerase/epimerase [Haloarcula sinaiiensis ATCC 33800]
MNWEPQTAIQLYSVRSLTNSLPEIIRRVADAGYDGVEFANRFQEESPESVAAVLEETEIEPVAVHADLSTIEKTLDGDADLIERCQIIGCDTLIVPHLPTGEFRTRQAVRSLSYRLRDVAAGLGDYDMHLGLHNDRRLLAPLLPDGAHTLVEETPVPARVGDTLQTMARRWEPKDPEQISSETPLWNLIARTRPSELCFEVEVAEIQTAGYDPGTALELFDGRAEMIHLRDVASAGFLSGYENVPHGDGIVEMDCIIEAATRTGVDWIVYENELDSDPNQKIEEGASLLDRIIAESQSSSESETALQATQS